MKQWPADEEEDVDEERMPMKKRTSMKKRTPIRGCRFRSFWLLAVHFWVFI